MPALAWTDALLLGDAAMDRMHREFVEVTAALTAADSVDGFAAALRAFVVHAEAHFADEERAMAESAFPAAACHADEHAAVLRSARELLPHVEAGDVALGREFAAELVAWFPAHVAHLDSALAHWLVKRRHGGAPLVLRRDLARA